MTIEYETGKNCSLVFAGGDRRLTARLEDLWAGARLGAEPYVRAEVFLSFLGEEILPDCCSVTLSDDGEWALDRIGAVLGGQSGIGAESAKAADIRPHSLISTCLDLLKDACTAGRPVTRAGKVLHGSGQWVPFRSILLPLHGEDGHSLQFLAAARCPLPLVPN